MTVWKQVAVPNGLEDFFFVFWMLLTAVAETQQVWVLCLGQLVQTPLQSPQSNEEIL